MLLVVPICDPFRSTSYPVTPLLVDAVHAIVAVLLVEELSVGVPGADGAVAAVPGVPKTTISAMLPYE